MLKFKDQQAGFLKEVNRGKNIQALNKWNQLIVEKLGINNMAIFGILTETAD